jgi:hypothetical protein
VADVPIFCYLLYWSDADYFFIDLRKNAERLANALGVAALSFSISFSGDLVSFNRELVPALNSILIKAHYPVNFRVVILLRSEVANLLGISNLKRNFEQVTKMLAEIQQTYKEVLSNMDSYRIRHRMIDHLFSDHHSQLQIFKHSARQSEPETERVFNAVFEIPKVLSLATLLDSRNGGGDLGPSNQSPADDAMKKKRKKKKRRGLRM